MSASPGAVRAPIGAISASSSAAAWRGGRSGPDSRPRPDAVAIAGYLLAVMALSGGVSTLTRVASLVPFWSPFIMLTRLTVGRAEAWEIGAAYALLVAAILVVGVIAVRVYSAGVLLYGQRPGLRAIVGAVVNPPV